eukprot:gb/GECH01001776.1/.p1 GENE.gb/GECH01001776.1/~~gb/GECH01001776.1/.p1  ORF type:complete len:494 (+),score=69.06 gb/GECH01001776.1/:1-1482(+)
MNSKKFFLIVFCWFFFITLSECITTQKNELQLVHEWKHVMFNFPNNSMQSQYINEKHYRNVAIAGVKLDSSGHTYVSLPRWKPHVPATLATLPKGSKKTDPQLEPFPSWDMNSLDNENGLNSILGFEIDKHDRMWILDQGRALNSAKYGEPKLVIWDLKENKKLHQHIFHTDIANSRESFLNDIVVDTDHEFAYITDSGVPIQEDGELKPALIIYDYKEDHAFRIFNSTTFTYAQDIDLRIEGEPCFKDKTMVTGADGIALSCDSSILYWCALTSRELFGIKTQVLRDIAREKINQVEATSHIVELGNKTAASDGLGNTAGNQLFMTDLEQSAIIMANETMLSNAVRKKTSVLPGKDGNLVSKVVQKRGGLRWPDTIGFSRDGYMYMVSNRLCRFEQDLLSFDEINFRIWRTNVDDVSYVYGCDARPQTSSADSHVGIILGSCMGAAVLLSIIGLGVYFFVSRKRKQKMDMSSAYEPLVMEGDYPYQRMDRND